ncbi:hypothetical protein G3T14_23210 [Methylobacterium sp. BTF04]|uniref:hypothetical protein n=1 Tax=Methylobacterium sp. BTF04 TaxID=2708300 RepID=UPI0013CFA1B7|nr:hypothetical protein [Methylobacterium sp. BTF04]NEU14959.1 hypothetical protein [Methylobacterium sp. BTF04]
MDRHARVTADIDSYGSAVRLDRLLRFNATVADRYERECGAARAASLRHLIVVGLTFYNVYNLTSIFLLPDILGLSVVLRLFVVTPASLCLAWAVGRVGARTREWLVTGGVLNAFAIPVFLFWLTEARFGGFTFSELTLVIVFGNMLLALRFPQAIVFTLCAFGLATTAVLLKVGLEDGLRAAFVLQIATGCAFCLYANYRMEALRCHGYLKELGATVKSEVAEAARDHFLDLSMTDALTGLPNRRSLDHTTELWSAAGAEL